MKKFDSLCESIMTLKDKTNLQEQVITPSEDERKFEFCLQKLNETGTGVTDEFQTVIEYGTCGHDAYAKVREKYPDWKVFTWGEYNVFHLGRD
jgi:hypothetical protein